MSTWQTICEQLQEFLNECIKLWWKLYWSDDIKEIIIDDEWFIIYWEDWWCPLEMSYHDLFSKDSWIMEFVERKEEENIKSITITEHWWFQYNIKRSPYYEMSWLTAEEKVIYFNKNAKLPTKSE